MDRFMEKMQALWASLSGTWKVVAIAAPLLFIILAAGSIALVVGQPAAQAPLFKNLDTADAGRMVAELKKQGVDYELDNEGRDIYVPASQVYELRLELANMGLPQGQAGFELFDESKLGQTESGMRIDYQRALQGELARTLEALHQVSSASVILSIAPQTSFLDVDSRSTAAVTLDLIPGQRLLPIQIEGVRHLVARSVSRLAPEDVAIVDGFGNPLKSEDDDTNADMIAGMELTELHRRFRNRIERDMEDKIRRMLEGPYGRGRVSPAVSVEIDFSQLRREREVYTPVLDDQGLEAKISEHRLNEDTKDEELGGVPGTTTNLPGYLGVTGGEAQATNKTEYDLEVEYLNNRELTFEDIPPGAITRRSASVALATDTWDETIKAGVEQAVINAIGADLANGDNVFAQAFAWSETSAAAVQTEYATTSVSRNLRMIIGWVVALLMVAMAMLFLRSIVKSAFSGEERQLALATGARPKSMLPMDDEGEGFTLRPLDSVSQTQQDRMRDEIATMIDNSPDAVVALLRTWMLED